MHRSRIEPFRRQQIQPTSRMNLEQEDLKKIFGIIPIPIFRDKSCSSQLFCVSKSLSKLFKLKFFYVLPTIHFGLQYTFFSFVIDLYMISLILLLVIRKIFQF